MTHKEKAKEIYDEILVSIAGCCINDRSAHSASIKCSKIMVENIIAYTSVDFERKDDKGEWRLVSLNLSEYWSEVKEEIEKLEP